MHDFVEGIANTIVDRSADELIGAVMIALALALAFAGLDYVGRRKARDNRMPMIVIMIGSNLVSMAVAAGYVAHIRKARAALSREMASGGFFRVDPVRVESIFRTADKNRDGLLSSEEAAVSAAEFVRRADAKGNGLIDPSDLEQALWATGGRRGPRPPLPSFSQ